MATWILDFYEELNNPVKISEGFIAGKTKNSQIYNDIYKEKALFVIVCFFYFFLSGVKYYYMALILSWVLWSRAL
jgi:hypothetical protein